MTENNTPSGVPSDEQREATLAAELAAQSRGEHTLSDDCPACAELDAAERQERAIVRELQVPTHPETDAGGGNRETWTMGSYNIGPYQGQVRIDVGAGLGDSHLAMLVEVDSDDQDAPPTSYWEYVDMTTLTELWLSRIIDQHHAAAMVSDAEADRNRLSGPLVPAIYADPILVKLPALNDDQVAEATAWEQDLVEQEQADRRRQDDATEPPC